MKNHNFLEDQMLNTLNQEVQRAKNLASVPPGYIEVALSTKGRVGAPAIVHVRNFTVGELLELSLTTDTDLPRRLITTLNKAIYEDTDVANWHESEIEELLIYIYAEFYKSTLDSVEFPLLEEDYEFVKNGPDGEQRCEDLRKHRWVPRTSITLLRDIDPYEIPDDYSPEITIKNKKTGFYVTFSYVKYGDRLLVKNWLDKIYRDEEKQFDALVETLKHNSSVTDPAKRLPVDPVEKEAYSDFVAKKLGTLTEVSRLISVVNYNGQDVSKMDIDEKYKLLSQDARIDYGMIAKLAARQDKQPFGLKPFIHMVNPLTNEPCVRRFSFRILSILQAMQLSGSDEYDDGFDDENS